MDIQKLLGSLLLILNCLFISHVQSSQTIPISSFFIIGIDTYPLSDSWKKVIQTHPLGGVIFISNNYQKAEHVQKTIDLIQTLSPNPENTMFFCIDQEGGTVNRIKKGIPTYPSAKKIASYDSERLVEHVSQSSAYSLKNLGININFAPVIDVNQSADNTVIGSRSFSDNPDDVIRFGQAFVKGHLKQGVIPVLKHFPGHGQTIKDSHVDLPIHAYPDTAESIDLKPFYSLIQSGAPAIMMGHLLYPQFDMTYPASLSSTITTSILKQGMGFSGLIFSDDLSMGAIQNKYSLHKASILSLKAGVHQLIVITPPDTLSALFKSLTQHTSSYSEFSTYIHNHYLELQELKNIYFNELMVSANKPSNVVFPVAH